MTSRTPLDFGPQGRITDPEELLLLVRSARAPVSSIGGEAKLSLESPQGGGKLTAMIAARAPSSFRVDLFSPFGPVSTLASDGATLRLIDHLQEVAEDGPATAEGLSTVLPVRLPPAELVTLLLGDAPLTGAAAVKLDVDDEARAYRLTLSAPDGLWTLWIEPATLLPMRLAITASALHDACRIDWSERDASPHRFARRMRIATLDGRQSLDLRWRELTPDEPHDAGLFSPEPPKNFTRLLRGR